MQHYLFIICAFFYASLQTCAAHRFLLYPLNSQSHIRILLKFGEVLTAANHSVDILMASNNHFQVAPESKIRILEYPVSSGIPLDDLPTISEYCVKSHKSGESSLLVPLNTFVKDYAANTGQFIGECEELLNNSVFIAMLKNNQYDFVLMDNFEIACAPTLPYKLNVSFGIVAMPMLSWFYRLPVLPSVMPYPASNLSDKMSFLQRFYNTLFYLLAEFYAAYHSRTTYFSAKYAPERGPPKSAAEIQRSAELFFFAYDHVLFYPVPRMPNSIDVGDLLMGEVNEVPEEYQRVLESDKKVILFSMGTVFNHMPRELEFKFCSAFAMLYKHSVTVIWKSNRTPQCPRELPSNVIVKAWIPQNDLLGHRNLSLFITHMGVKSYMEAAYQGTPMIAFPFFNDQYGNAAAMMEKGLGVTMDLITFTPKELVDNINMMLSDKEGMQFRQNTQRVSMLLREKPLRARQEVEFWLDHVIKYGGKHLRSKGQELSFVEFFMLDVTLVFFCLFVIVCGLTAKIGRYLLDKYLSKYHVFSKTTKID